MSRELVALIVRHGETPQAAAAVNIAIAGWFGVHLNRAY
jgi:hypothetical protein